MIREKKISQIYSQIQTGSKLGMNTLEQRLNDLLRENLISEDEAISKASLVKALDINLKDG